MTPAEKQRKKQFRISLLDKQYHLERIHCAECPTSKVQGNPNIKCDGCSIYAQLRTIGKTLVPKSFSEKEF